MTPLEPIIIADADVAPPLESAAARIDVQSLTAADAHWVHDALGELLCDAVNAGDCLGFVAPLSREEADRYWVALQPTLDVDHALWIARRADRVVGSVQLHGCGDADAAHRAEVSRLIVRADARLRGVATALMGALERHAFEAGRSLLVLDVDSGAPAEATFARLGWRQAGRVPGYALAADGGLRTFARLYKELTAQER